MNQLSTVGSKILKATTRGAAIIATLLLTIEVSMLKDSNLASAYPLVLSWGRMFQVVQKVVTIIYPKVSPICSEAKV